MNNIHRVLVLAPHTDDGEFGCGGSIARFVGEGKEVYYIAFSTAEKSVPAHLPKDILKTEVRAATQKLGILSKNLIVYDYEVRKLNYYRQDILEDLVKIKKEIEPDLVFLPSLNDLHQDHKTVANEAVRAFKDKTLLGYEVPWNNITFHTQAFILLSETDIETKIAALDAYDSQKGKNYANADYIKSLARTRGVQIGAHYAEAFDVVRWIMP